MGKPKENWNFGKYEIGKYQENWKYGKFKKRKIGNVENLENVNKNKCKNLKGYTIWNKYNYIPLSSPYR